MAAAFIGNDVSYVHHYVTMLEGPWYYACGSIDAFYTWKLRGVK